jgi:hypothetical protein
MGVEHRNTMSHALHPILALPLGEGREDRVPHALNDVRTKVP